MGTMLTKLEKVVMTETQNQETVVVTLAEFKLVTNVWANLDNLLYAPYPKETHSDVETLFLNQVTMSSATTVTISAAKGAWSNLVTTVQIILVFLLLVNQSKLGFLRHVEMVFTNHFKIKSVTMGTNLTEMAAAVSAKFSLVGSVSTM